MRYLSSLINLNQQQKPNVSGSHPFDRASFCSALFSITRYTPRPIEIGLGEYSVGVGKDFATFANTLAGTPGTQEPKAFVTSLPAELINVRLHRLGASVTNLGVSGQWQKFSARTPYGQELAITAFRPSSKNIFSSIQGYFPRTTEVVIAVPSRAFIQTIPTMQSGLLTKHSGVAAAVSLARPKQFRNS